MRGGGTLTLRPRFDPHNALEPDGVTISEGVPTMYVAMLHSDKAYEADTSCLRLWVFASHTQAGHTLCRFE
jgi:long-chain acyl-CoA synthetase